MNKKPFNQLARSVFAVMAATALSPAALGQQVLFTENFDAPDPGANWTINAATARDEAVFGFDYSTVGIPPAPGGTTTLGLKLQANRPIDAGALSGVSVSPLEKTFTGDYVLEYDLWLNFPGPAPDGGTGSTQITGAGIMTAGATAHYAGSGDGLWFATSGEGGSSSDFRAYFRGVNQTTVSLYPAGGQNQTATYYQTNFPGGVSAPAAQTALFPSQTGLTGAGTLGWQWRKGKVTKLGNSVTWEIDGIRLANIDLTAAGVEFGGENILFAQSDINGTQTTTELEPLLFGLIDNVKVTRPSTPVSIALLTDATTPEQSGSALFQISRPLDDTANALTINIILRGTATRGDGTTGDYFIRTNAVTIPAATSVTIPAGAQVINVEAPVLEDDVSELSETVVLELAPGQSYTPTEPPFATATITDNDAPVVDMIAVVFDQMYEGNTNDLVRFSLQRMGDLNAASFDVNIAYSGTATAQDHSGPAAVTFNPGDVTALLDVHPTNDDTVEERETLIASITPGTGYAIGSNPLSAGATGIIVNDDVEPGTVVYSEGFEEDSSANWTILFGAATPDVLDYTAVFGFNYGQDGFSVPPAPHSASGTTFGLLMSVNKLDETAQSAGVNAYPNGQQFSGNYAIRFDMYLMQNNTAGTTENAVFGINHSGTKTNWYTDVAAAIPDGWEFDGIWASVVADAASLPADPRARAYQLFSAPGVALDTVYGPTLLAGREASSLANVFHRPPWSPGSGPGSPGNTPDSATRSWAQVELSQVNGVITLTVNNTNILSYVNSGSFNAGNIMLGYVDAYNSIGSGGGGLVIYDNLRVVQLGGGPAGEIRIASISRDGNNVQIDFTAGPGEPITAFDLFSAPTVIGPYGDDTTATIVSQGGSNYRVTTTASDTMRFYQIKRAQ